MQEIPSTALSGAVQVLSKLRPSAETGAHPMLVIYTLNHFKGHIFYDVWLAECVFLICKQYHMQYFIKFKACSYDT